jgi:S1-C subfamily serine protease
MKKTWFALAACAALSLCSLQPAYADGWDIDARNAQVDETNFIVGDGCSGTLISAEFGLILTAYHCIETNVRQRAFEEVDENGVIQKVTREELLSMPVSQLRYVDYQPVSAAEFVTDIVAHQQTRDLALLQMRVDAPTDQSAPLLPEPLSPRRSEGVWIVGNPLMLDASISNGTISSVSRTIRVPWANNQEVPLIQFDAAGEPGSSGGALYNDSGQLIGVVIAGVSKQMFAVPIEAIRAFLRDKGFGDELLGDPVPESELPAD